MRRTFLKLRAHLDTVGAPEEKRWALGIYGQTGALAQTTTQAGRLEQRLSVFGLVS